MPETRGIDTRLVIAVIAALIIGIAVGAFAFKGEQAPAQQQEAEATTPAQEEAPQEEQAQQEQAANETPTEAETQPAAGQQEQPQQQEQAQQEEMQQAQPPIEDVASAVNLRVNVGRAAGIGLALQGYTSIAVVSQDNLLCSVLGSSLATAYEAQTGRDAGLYLIRPGVNEAAVAEQIAAGGYQAVVLAYGGGAQPEQVQAAFKDFTYSLMTAGYNGTIVVHAAALAAKALDAALADQELCSYLKNLEVLAYAPKPEEGKLYYYQANITGDCTYTLEKKAEYPIPPAKLPPAETLTQGAPVRLKVGAAAGIALYELNFTSPAILAQRNGLCTTIAAATAASYNSMAGKLPKVAYLDPGLNEEQAVAAVLEANPDIIILQFGGETPGADAKLALEKTLATLRDNGYQGALMIHAALYASKVFQSTVPEYCDYLQQLDLYLYLPDAETGQLKIFKVTLQDCNIQLEGPIHVVSLP